MEELCAPKFSKNCAKNSAKKLRLFFIKSVTRRANRKCFECCAQILFFIREEVFEEKITTQKILFN